MNLQNDSSSSKDFEKIKLGLESKSYISNNDVFNLVEGDIKFINKIKIEFQNDPQHLSILERISNELKDMYDKVIFATILNWHPTEKDQELLRNVMELKLNLINSTSQ